ncbi:unnamed protein product [Rhizopus microsporus]
MYVYDNLYYFNHRKSQCREAQQTIIKNRLFDEGLSNPSYADQLQPDEYPVCKLIIQSLKSYIPKKKYYSILAHQLPFVILANDILKYTGYDKFCMNVCPLPTASTINAMRLDTPSLYHLPPHSDPAKFQILDFDDYLIDSEDQARRHMDAVFGSIFDLATITSVLQSSGLKFAQNITILPGLKSVHLLGTKIKQSKSTHENQQNEQGRFKKIMHDPLVIQESQKMIETLQQEIDSLQAQASELTNLSKMINKEGKSANYSQMLKSLHLQWKSGSALERQQLYPKIEQVKQLRNDSFNKRIHIQNQLRNRRKQLHIKRMAIMRKKKIANDRLPCPPESESQLTHAQVIDKGSYGLAKSENSLFSPNVNVAQDFTFSGIDNGLHTMTDTVAFTLKRFKFHL